MKLKEAVIKQILYFITGYMFSKISPKPPHSQGSMGGGGESMKIVFKKCNHDISAGNHF